MSTAAATASTSLTQVSSTPETRTRKRNPRGQGDLLRAEIVAAAATLLDQSGNAEAVTLRAVARQAHISPPSIYRHFPDPPAILLAVTQEAFEELRHQLSRASESAGGAEADDPTARLTAICESYLSFAAEHPSRYRVMFGGAWTAHPAQGSSVTEADLTNLGSEALGVLAAALIDCVDAGTSTSTQPGSDVVALWLGLHGLAHQRAVSRGFPWPTDIEGRMIHHLARLTSATRSASR